MNAQAFVGLVLLGLLALTVWFHSPAPSLPDGSKPVPTTAEFHWKADDNDIDGTFVVKDTVGAELGRWYLYDDQLYVAPGANPRATATLVRDYALIKPVFDLGTWAGYFNRSGEEGPNRFQIGLRFSPMRIAFGTLALDTVVSRDVAGAGVSLYPPTRLGRWWRHWGLGAWYTAPFNGTAPGFAAGLSFSTRD